MYISYNVGMKTGRFWLLNKEDNIAVLLNPAMYTVVNCCFHRKFFLIITRKCRLFFTVINASLPFPIISLNSTICVNLLLIEEYKIKSKHYLR